ncbi:hypothetical protein C1646_767139 [Rhizophagus diaphanus]|nr:hypothetical protein C1646_767139 [Rhizophagus diaphanus] [Rhizophagus sp. MUCL 43196]
MPPHTSLHYTMPPNTTNSKSTATTANSGTTQMNTSNKSSSTPSKTSRQRRAVSSSYVFAPSWLNLNNNKSGTPTTVLSSAYVSTTEEKSVKEEVKGVGASKKEGFGGIRQAKEGLVKDGSSSLNRSATPLLSTRSKSRDLSSSRSSAFGETENHESSVKLHGRSRSVSQVNQSTPTTSSSFDKNFPTLAKKKQLNLSVDLPAKNVENIWANLEAKSKLLSPTSTPNAEENIKFSIPNIDNEPELERRMSLVPKVESGKLDGKRPKHSIKRKTSRSLSVDSVARGTNGSSVFGFGVGIGIPNGRSLGQTQNARSYLRENTAKPISSQPQRQRAASISASNGIKKISVTTPRMGSFGQSTITGRKSSIGGNSKYLWSNATMGKMGSFKIFTEEEEEEEEELLNDRKEVNVNDCDHIEEEEEEDEENINNNTCDKKASVKVNQNNYHTDESPSSSPTSSSLEREEKFLLELGWKKPYNKDTDSKEWAITEEEKRFFVNFVRTLNGISVSEKNEAEELSYNEINNAKRKWAALLKNFKNMNRDKMFMGCYQSNGKRVTFNDEN